MLSYDIKILNNADLEDRNELLFEIALNFSPSLSLLVYSGIILIMSGPLIVIWRNIDVSI